MLLVFGHILDVWSVRVPIVEHSFPGQITLALNKTEYLFYGTNHCSHFLQHQLL